MTQNGLPFALGRRAGGWFGAERGSFEFMLKPAKDGLKVDLGAGRVLAFKKLGKRKAVPAAIAGTYVSADSGATWRIARSGDGYALEVSGPLIAGGAAWPMTGVDPDTVEIDIAGGWLQATQLAHLVRDRAGKIAALEVSTGRIKKMRFERVSGASTRYGLSPERGEDGKSQRTGSRTSGRRWSTARSGRARA